MTIFYTYTINSIARRQRGCSQTINFNRLPVSIKNKLKSLRGLEKNLYRKKNRTKLKFTECHCLTECSLKSSIYPYCMECPPFIQSHPCYLSIFTYSSFFWKKNEKSEWSVIRKNDRSNMCVCVLYDRGHCHTIEFQLVHAG